MVEHALCRGPLHDPARVHHLHRVAELRHDAQVVGDQDDRGAPLGGQPLQQVEHLRLGGHVQRRGRLVGDQHVRVVGQGHGDHDPLPHAAGVLVRVVGQPPVGMRDLDVAQQPDGQLPGPAPADRLVRPDRLDHLLADRLDRIQPGHRILEHHGDLAAADRGQLALPQRPDVPAVEVDLAAGDLPRRLDQAQDGQAERGLAGAGLADDAHPLQPPDVEADVPDRGEHAVGSDEVRPQAADAQHGIARIGRPPGQLAGHRAAVGRSRTRGSMTP